MKHKTLILFASLALFGFSLHSQTLSPTVISSSGGFFDINNAGMLSFTVAEMTMVETFAPSGGNNILTQGFQQPEDLTVSIPENPVSEENILIYPNPTNGFFTLSYLNNSSSESTIKLYNIIGQVVLSKTINQINGINTVKFDINYFKQGIYMLEMTMQNSIGENKTYYKKINLIY